MNKAFILSVLLLGPAVMHGVCPQPTPKVCSAFFESDAVFVGTVVSQQVVPDKDDSSSIEGWRYQLRVDRSFRGLAMSTAWVHTPNDSGRLVLNIGHQYVLFAVSRGGTLEIGSDCGPLSDASHMTETIREIENLRRATSAVVEGEVRKATASGAGVRGVNVTVTGLARPYRLTTDRQGLFRALVPPGRYRIELDSRVAALSDLSWINPKSVDLFPGQCAQAQYISR